MLSTRHFTSPFVRFRAEAAKNFSGCSVHLSPRTVERQSLYLKSFLDCRPESPELAGTLARSDVPLYSARYSERVWDACLNVDDAKCAICLDDEFRDKVSCSPVGEQVLHLVCSCTCVLISEGDVHVSGVPLVSPADHRDDAIPRVQRQLPPLRPLTAKPESDLRGQRSEGSEEFLATVHNA